MTNDPPIQSGTTPGPSIAGSGEVKLNRHRYIRLGVFIVILVVTAVHLQIYLASPTGRFPVLDGAENFLLARQIATGTLPHEPFFRAMLYPLILSIFLKLGISVAWLPVVAGILGVACHFGSVLCVYWLSRRAWASGRAGIVASALFGLNPVAIYFAAEPLDTTLGIFLFLTSLNAIHFAITKLSRKKEVAPRDANHVILIYGAGIALLALATLARPHYAIVLAGMPMILLAYFWRRRDWLLKLSVSFVIPAGLILGSAGFIQKRWCGEFRFMPTQGAYSLWVGNRPGANGRYYEQQIHFDPGAMGAGENPARVESELLYRKETGNQGPILVDQMNRYWREKTKTAIRQAPGAWIGLMLRKTYYLFNNFEQYNNKTFAIQRQLSRMLEVDWLNWGISFILCVTGVVLAYIKRIRCFGAMLAVLAAAFYAGGVILFFVSDRFRLPLLPFLCVMAGVWGTVSLKNLFLGRHLIALLVAGGVAGALTFSRGWDVHDLSPAIQDYVLLSSAAGKAGADIEELRWARKGLQAAPDNSDALACAVAGFYNTALQGGMPGKEFPDETWSKQVERVKKIQSPAPGVRLAGAIAAWKTGRAAEAKRDLESLASEGQKPDEKVKLASDDAQGVLLLTGLGGTNEERTAIARANESNSFYLLVALLRRDTPGHPMLPANRRDVALQAAPFVKNIFQ